MRNNIHDPRDDPALVESNQHVPEDHPIRIVVRHNLVPGHAAKSRYTFDETGVVSADVVAVIGLHVLQYDSSS